VCLPHTGGCGRRGSRCVRRRCVQMMVAEKVGVSRAVSRVCNSRRAGEGLPGLGASMRVQGRRQLCVHVSSCLYCAPCPPTHAGEGGSFTYLRLY
jgi:hypothetical protein